jgi:hypothetical protein
MFSDAARIDDGRAKRPFDRAGRVSVAVHLAQIVIPAVVLALFAAGTRP